MAVVGSMEWRGKSKSETHQDGVVIIQGKREARERVGQPTRDESAGFQSYLDIKPTGLVTDWAWTVGRPARLPLTEDVKDRREGTRHKNGAEKKRRIWVGRRCGRGRGLLGAELRR